MSKIIPSPQWLDKGTYKEPLDGDNIRVPRLEVDDATTFIDKDASNNMTFEDAVTGSKTLAELTRSLLVVAASNASAKSKEQADYVCDGTDDQVEIQAAIDALAAAGGEIRLSEGTYTFASGVTVNFQTTGKVHLIGYGATINHNGTDYAITLSDNFTGYKYMDGIWGTVEGLIIIGTASGAGGIKLVDADICALRDLTINNYSAGDGIRLDRSATDCC